MYIELDTFEKDDNGNCFGIGSYCITDMEMWTDNLIGAYEEQQEYSAMQLVNSTFAAVESQIDSIEESSEISTDLALNGTTITLPDEPNIQSNISNNINAFNSTIRFTYVTINNGTIQIPCWEFAGHRYTRFDNVGFDWLYAEYACRLMGGHLVTFTSNQERNFVVNNIISGGASDHYALGVYRESTNAKWKTITGESMDYMYSQDDLDALPNFYLYYSPKNTPLTILNSGFICEWEPGRAIRDPNNSMAYSILLPSGTKFISLDGKLSPTSKIDTDGDGIPDWDEINFDAIKKINGSDTVTLAECLQHLRNLGFKLDPNFYMSKMDPSKGSQYDFDILSKLNVYPVKSDPTDPDTDGDYYLDGVDSEPLTWQRMTIPDSSIDDSNSIYKINPSTSVSAKTTDGKISSVTVDGGEKKNVITFNRSNQNKNDKQCQFSLKPKKYGDYMITVSNVNSTALVNPGSFLTVNNKAEQYHTPELNAVDSTITYYYSLREGVDYTIKVTNSVAQPNFTVSVSQDNWVYAPNGGVRTYNNYADITNYNNIETFLTDETIVDLLYQTGNRTILNWDGFLKSPDDALKTIRKSTVAGLEPWTAKIFGEVIEDGLNLSYSNTISIRTVAGGVYSATGFVLSTLIGPQVGTIFKTAKPVLFSDYVWSNTESAKLKNALNNGKYNICIRPQKALVDGNLGTGHLMNYIEYEPWNNTRYINKYSKNIRGEVTPFETSTVVYLNGKWQEIQ